MAEKSIVDSGNQLPTDASHQPSLKDMHGSDNSMPLSPQWLQTKSGDNKMGIEYHTSPYHGERTRSLKETGNGEDSHEVGKRKDVYKLHDSEIACRDRWRDEERETNSNIRRDHKGERWPDNSMRHSGERRNPSERWSESGNRESSFDQRRESKWNTRWGPDDKESEPCKDGQGPHEKIMPRIASHGRDTDKEGEIYSHSWRTNSSLARGKAEPSYQQCLTPLTPHKQIHMFGYGRGKGENGSPLSPSGHGSFNYSNASTVISRHHHCGTFSAKSGLQTGSSLLRYSRMKLLDIYRMTDIRSHRVSVDGIIDVPSLTRSELLEPLALSAPTVEELVIFKAIEKGEVASSGVPQASKEGTAGRNAVESVMSKQMKLETHEDFQCVGGDYKLEGSGRNPNIEPVKKMLETPSKKADSMTEEMRIPESQFSRSAAPCRSQSNDISCWPTTDLKDDLAALGATSSEWSHLSKDVENDTTGASVFSSFCKDGRQNNQYGHVEDRSNLKIRSNASEISDRVGTGNPVFAHDGSLLSRDKLTARNFEPLPTPEELSLYYRDPQGRVQGPFSGSDLIGWFEAGYFGVDLGVRLASAPPDAPFLSLGDVIPQLRLKVRPPPGFCLAKQNEILEMSNMDKNGSTVLSSHSGIIGYEPSKSVQRSGNSTEANSQFVESLSEGMHGRGVHGPGFSPSLIGESGNGVNYLLAQTRLLEQRQDALPNSLPLLSGRDSSPMASSMGIFSNSPEPYSKFISHIGEPSFQASQISQASRQLNLLSLLQAGHADKPPSLAASAGASVRPNFPDAQTLYNNGHVGLEISDNNMDVHQHQHLGSQFGFVVQQQQPQPHNFLSLPHLVNQSSNLSGIVSPEQLRSSDITQDTQMLNTLAQHYLLSQAPMHSQISVPSQLSLFNECLLLKHQLHQQQQQLLLQQQQLLLSQVFSGHQSSPHLGQSSQNLHSSLPAGDVPTDDFLLRQGQETQIYQKILADDLHDEHDSTLQKVNLQHSNNTHNSFCFGPSLLQLPHQIYDIALPSKQHENTQDVGDNGASDVSLTAEQVVTSSVSDALEKHVEAFDSSDDALNLICLAEERKLSMPQHSEFISSECSVLSQEVSSNSGFESPIVNQIDDIKISSDNVIEAHHTDDFAVKYSKNMETCQTQKSAEKKARKKKNSKPQLALDLLRGFSIGNQFEQPKAMFETEDPNSHDLSDAQTDILKQPNDFVSTAVVDSSNSSLFKPVDYLKSSLTANKVESSNKKAECVDGGFYDISSLRAWKSAPGVKVKSLKEIQQEEQQRVQMEKMASEIIPSCCQVSVPWVGIVGGFDNNSGGDTVQVDSNAEYILRSGSNLSSKSRKSHLHDLLAEEVLAQSSDGDGNLSRDKKGQLLPPVLSATTLVDASRVNDVNLSKGNNGQLLSPVLSAATLVDTSAVNDEDFFEAKEFKKGRKKGSKAKVSGAKSPSTVSSFDVSSPSIAVERRKSQNQAQKEKEVLPVPLTASLADFVSWKGEQANSSQAPAWSVDMGKIHKPISLRDIQKEQENKFYAHQDIPIPSPAKMQSNGGKRSGSWQVPGSSPSSGTSPIQSSTLASRQLKPKLEDHLFWDPVDQSKQQIERSEFPSLRNSNSWGAKTPSKTNPITINRQKSSNSRPAGHSPASSASSLSASRGKKDDEPSNLSEAMGFRDWCDKELIRLTGTNDTSFLEYCLKQSTTEAEMLLKENLASLDPNHEFIDKFLSYKDLLSSKVIEIAFRANGSHPIHGDEDAGPALGGFNADAETGKVGRKKGNKGKKGKKGSAAAAALGFNVTSNRIMKGDIQTVED